MQQVVFWHSPGRKLERFPNQRMQVPTASYSSGLGTFQRRHCSEQATWIGSAIVKRTGLRLCSELSVIPSPNATKLIPPGSHVGNRSRTPPASSCCQHERLYVVSYHPCIRTVRNWVLLGPSESGPEPSPSCLSVAEKRSSR